MSTFYMPTKVIEEEQVVRNNGRLFTGYGNKALIVTGKTSSKINGSLKDVAEVLEENHIEYTIFDDIQENPPLENIIEGANVGEGCNFIIGIGGGSPIDGAKAIGVLLNNKELEPYSAIFEETGLKSLPIIAIPTTAGTGTEVTPYAIITNHKKETKTNFSSKVFPEYALMDVNYFMSMPMNVRINTCVDALTHLVESYMNTNATVYSDYIALEGIRLWGLWKEQLDSEHFDKEAMTGFMNASTLGGMAISQTGTSLPHGMGYALTYFHQMPHGKANGILMAAYLQICKDQAKVKDIINALGFEELEGLRTYLKGLLGTLDIGEEEIQRYATGMAENKNKLKNHPDEVGEKEIVEIYRRSL